MVKQQQQIGSQEEYQQPGPLGNKILNQFDMQSTEAQGARAKTTTSRTSSTRSTRDQIPHVAITINGMDCTIIEETQPPTNVATQTWTSSPNTYQTSSATHQSAGAKRKRHDPEQSTEIRNFPDHQAEQSNPPHSEASRHDLQRGTRKAAWTPHQTYDNQGCANFHENSEGTVLTSPSGHPYCAYCRTTSHPRSTCPMRARHLTQGINRLYHPQKGMARSNNEQRRCNKFPDETIVANHNIAGASKIRAESIYNNEVSPPKHFIQPKNAKKFVNKTDK